MTSGLILGRRQAARHGSLAPAYEGSNPSAPAIYTYFVKGNLDG